MSKTLWQQFKDWWNQDFPAQVIHPEAELIGDPRLHTDEGSLPHCRRKICGHSAILHSGWPENGNKCLAECGCRKLIL